VSKSIKGGFSHENRDFHPQRSGRHRPLLPGLRLRRPGHHLRPDSRGPRHRRYPRGHRRTGGAELQERGRHSGGR
ncbi:Nuclease associated modular domain-containing protein, partial [Dysosmobacter welbionis]